LCDWVNVSSGSPRQRAVKRLLLLLLLLLLEMPIAYSVVITYDIEYNVDLFYFEVEMLSLIKPPGVQASILGSCPKPG